MRSSRKSFYDVDERKQVIDVLRCDEQAFKYHSNIDKTCAAADTEVKSNKLNFRQSYIIEIQPIGHLDASLK
jgi:hypothetical protein